MNIEEVRISAYTTPVAPDLQIASSSTIMMPEAFTAPRAEQAVATGTGSANFVYNGGPLLTNVDVQAIFLGSTWTQGTSQPSAQDVLTAVQNILSGSYMSALSQYGNIGQGKLLPRAIADAANPPNPFSVQNLVSEISALIGQQEVPAPGSDKQLLYFAFLPAGVSSNNNAFGAHGYFIYKDGSRVHYAWLVNNGNLQFVTAAFSYLLVGSCTDPEGNGIVGAPGTCSQQGWCEIGAVCQQPAIVNGVSVWPYWSQRDRTCVAPGS